ADPERGEEAEVEVAMVGLAQEPHLAGEVARHQPRRVALDERRGVGEPRGERRDRRLDVVVHVLRPQPELPPGQAAGEENGEELALDGVLTLEGEAFLQKLARGKGTLRHEWHVDVPSHGPGVAARAPRRSPLAGTPDPAPLRRVRRRGARRSRHDSCSVSVLLTGATMRVPTLVAVLLLACAVPRAALATTVNDIPCRASSPPPGPCVVATAVAVSPGSTLDFGTRGLVLTGAGELDAAGGAVTVNAASPVPQPGALPSSAGPPGQIKGPTTGTIDVQAATNRAKVDVSGTSGGYIDFVAGGDLTIAGQLIAGATVVQGDGGSIDVTGANATLAAGGKISAMGGSNGFGGDVSVTASTGSALVAGTIDASAGRDRGHSSLQGEGA